MKYYLQIEKVQSEEELQEGQGEHFTKEYPSEQAVKDAAKMVIDMLFNGENVNAYLIINRHEEGESCSKILLNTTQGI